MKITRKIKHIIGNANLIRNASGIFHIVKTAAGMPSSKSDILVVVKLHGAADTLKPSVLCQAGSK